MLELRAKPASGALDPFPSPCGIDAHVSRELLDVGLTSQPLDRLADLTCNRPQRLAEVLAVKFVGAHAPIIARRALALHHGVLAGHARECSDDLVRQLGAVGGA